MNNEITVSGIFRSAWASFSEHISYVYYLMAPMFVLSLVTTVFFPEAYFVQGDQLGNAVEGLVLLVLFVVSMLVSIFPTISLLFFLRSGNKETYTSWKSYFRLLPKYIVVCILQFLMILVGLLLFIIPGIYLAFRYAFVSYRALEYPQEKIPQLFAAEAKATEGNRLTLFLLILCVFVAALATGMVLTAIFYGLLGSDGQGFVDFLVQLVVTPFFTVVSIITYLQLNGKQETEVVVIEAEPEEEKSESVEPVIAPEPAEPNEKTPEEGEEKEESKPAAPAAPAAEPVV